MANNNKNADEFNPKGTMVVLVIFFVTLIVLWASIYVILLGRGVTV